ncbi:MAG: hypothetical protein QM520_07035, partial [Gammaproteobacteria bacterium]|nr:hypothetical protein [Gammaproteobacteria bacterium]
MSIDDKNTSQAPAPLVKPERLTGYSGALVLPTDWARRLVKWLGDGYQAPKIPRVFEESSKEESITGEERLADSLVVSDEHDEGVASDQLSADFSLLQRWFAPSDTAKADTESATESQSLDLTNVPLFADFLLDLGNLRYFGVLNDVSSDIQANDFIDIPFSFLVAQGNTSSPIAKLLENDQQFPFLNFSATPVLGALALASMSLGNSTGAGVGRFGVSLVSDTGWSKSDGITIN